MIFLFWGSFRRRSFFRIGAWFPKILCFFKKVHFGGPVALPQGLRDGLTVFSICCLFLTDLFTQEAAAPWSPTKEYTCTPAHPNPLCSQVKHMYWKIVTQAFLWPIIKPSHNNVLTIHFPVPTHLFIDEKLKFRKRTRFPRASASGQHCWKSCDFQWREPQV